MPQQVFKRQKLFAHGRATPGAVYETSGTTTGQPGRQHLLDTSIYRAVAVEGARRVGFLEQGLEMHFIHASPERAPHSSLTAMFGFWAEAEPEGARFWVTGGDLPGKELEEALLRPGGRSLALCATALTWHYLLERWGEFRVALPPGSRLLETGGFKGRHEEITKAQLYERLSSSFGVNESAIWNEYGMSELSSQSYARGVEGIHATPPWARVLICDPATGREVGLNEEGLVRWIDLANVDSVMALQTLDRAVRVEGGFRLLGRLPRAEPRGCSLSAEDIVARTAGVP